MKFNIDVVQDGDIIIAKVTNEHDEDVCLGLSKSPYKAVENACSELCNIMKEAERAEDNEILKIVEEREKNDNGKTYTLKEVIQKRKEIKK